VQPPGSDNKGIYPTNAGLKVFGTLYGFVTSAIGDAFYGVERVKNTRLPNELNCFYERRHNRPDDVITNSSGVVRLVYYSFMC
jgi:hypothetical protein